MGILLTILFVLLGYYLLIFLGRLSLPWIRAYAHRKTEEYFKEFFDGNSPRPPSQEPEGSVSIDKMPPQKKKADQGVGEYIEFEEVE